MKHVAIVEDNIKIRNLIQGFLNMQQDMDCPIAVDSVEDMLQLMAEGHRPDVILMDIQLPGMSGIQGIREIRKKYSDTEIIMLTIYHDAHKIFDSLMAGASGYLLKHTSLPEIRESILTLLSGGAPMSPQIARRVIEHFNRPVANPDAEELLTT